ncbi:DUF4381 domain-containing protein [Lysobacter enzymogenes]|uniref:DUF4381 domain-containing protein n=1 Tax=Lysobacter enzymogenes TaxID=69 RepID=UPI001A976416|nr:DUF4381 domain-containing protein [Lysobacter enzymogenes]QQP95736.1 DUF4381 domain-containing protein [Lysobacter enzymogenes]
MAGQQTLALRDVHLPGAPSWWPLAPGWWLLLAVSAALALSLWWWQRRRARRKREAERVFDEALAAAATPVAQVAAISELLRRAGRRRDRAADTLDGQAWLEFLDRGSKRDDFAAGPGRLLLEGGYRRQVDPAQVQALRELARRRFLQWMGVRA